MSHYVCCIPYRIQVKMVKCKFIHKYNVKRLKQRIKLNIGIKSIRLQIILLNVTLHKNTQYMYFYTVNVSCTYVSSANG